MLTTLCLLLAAAPAPSPGVERGRPNVLIVVADDVAERDIDRIATPAFDALAARGLRFRRAYANPTCSPSRWSLTFGQYHSRDAGLACDGYRPEVNPDPEQASLPRLFSNAGYRTALFGKWHLGAHPGAEDGGAWELAPNAHGYDTWRAGMPANVTSCRGRSYFKWLRVDDGESAMSTDYNTHAIRDAFLAWLEEDAAEPWYAMVAFQTPHGPVHFPPDATVEEDSGPEGMAQSSRWKYELMVQSFDAALGSMLERIDLAETLVVVVGDNGTPSAFAGPTQAQETLKTTTFEDGIRVPMVWAGPGIERGAESRSLVHFVDVLPTLAEWIGASPRANDERDDELHGMSIAHVLSHPDAPAHEYVWCGITGRPSKAGDFAIVTPRYKYRQVGKRRFLYDLEEDPQEATNLAGAAEHARLAEELEGVLARHRPERVLEPRDQRRKSDVPVTKRRGGRKKD